MNDGTILVVDDESESLRLLTGILSAEGYQVCPADCGELALAFVKTRVPDLILLDIRMPGMDGFEVCRRLKAAETSRAIPLMFISAATEVQERVEGLALGAVDFISKPFRVPELLARARTHLELGRLRAKLENRVAERTAELRVANERLQAELAERKLVEQALRESEQRFRNLADTSPVGIWVTDPDKSVSFYNKTALNFAGCTMGQLIGNGWTELVHRQDLDGVNSTYRRAVEARRSFRIECRMRRVDGKYRWVLNTGTPRFVDSVYVGHIGTVVDITDIKRSHERMLASQKLESLGVLAAGMAHDFNNMLGAIFAESDLAQAEIPPDSPAIDNVKRISAVANRASEIVNLLMAYAGGRDTAIEMVDLSRIVEEMLELLRISILKNAVLQTSLPRDLPPVQANAAQLRQVVLNLIMNAWEALRDGGGRIVVSTEHIYVQLSAERRSAVPEGHYIRLMVSDTGCGMTEEVQARVFDPYFTTKLLGRGLGLAAVQGILRSHGATINVLSTPGVGSTFEVLLPCSSQPRHETLQDSHPQAAQNVLPASGTILLVEDEDTLRMATSSGLQKAGFSVLAVGDGRAAVNLFRARARDIDAVLLDVTLPGMSGLQVLKEIRQVKADVKVILTSAYDGERVNSRAALAGHSRQGFIRKPYRFFDLMRTLQDTLNERHSSVLGN